MHSLDPAPRRNKSRKSAIFLVIALLVVGFGFVRSIEHSKAEESSKAAHEHKEAAMSTELISAWKPIVANSQGNVNIAVYDHTNGETANYSNAGSATFNTASIVKLSILEDLLMQDQSKGESLTASQLAEAEPMIENSDNDAATALWDLDGGTSALDSFFKTVGANSTTAGQQSYWGLTQTTALDQLKVVNTLAYSNKLLTSSSVQAADGLLNNVESDQRWGVSGGVPAGVSVQLKNGWLQGSDTNPDTWDVNSIGHVHGDGVDYTIAVLTNGNSTEEYGIDTIQNLSSVTWKDLKA